MREVFPQLLWGTLVLQEHMQTTYQAPTYQIDEAILDPTIDLMELSGLAMVYATLREDQSDQPVREAWEKLLKSPQLEGLATRLLNILEIADGHPSMGISARSVSRTEWEMRLSRQIIEAGYAVPDFNPFQEQPPTRDVPQMIKMLGVYERGGSVGVEPRSIFAAEVIGPLSGEPKESLRSRRNLRRYFEEKDRHDEKDLINASGTAEEGSENIPEGHS